MGLNLSRGLLNLGEGLGGVIATVGQRQRDEMMAAREENLMRLQAQLRQQADNQNFEQQKQLLSVEDTMRGAAETRRQEFETGQLNTRMAHETQLQGQDDKLRRDLAGQEASLTRDRLAREEKMQTERYTREDMNLLERNYASQINQIDDRLARINDEITKQRAKAQTAGAELDPKILEPWQQEIAQLQQQKKLLGKERDIALSQFTNGRVKKLTPDEVEEERRMASGGGPTRRGGARGEAPKAAAMARAPGGVPEPPAKPKGMVDREQRRSRRLVTEEAPKKKDTGSITGEAGKGARDVANLLGNVSDSLGRRKQEPTLVKAAKAAMRGGEAPSSQQLQGLRQIGRDRLKGVYGFTDSQLAQIGL